VETFSILLFRGRSYRFFWFLLFLFFGFAAPFANRPAASRALFSAAAFRPDL
jgi:hypothetical protein